MLYALLKLQTKTNMADEQVYPMDDLIKQRLKCCKVTEKGLITGYVESKEEYDGLVRDLKVYGFSFAVRSCSMGKPEKGTLQFRTASIDLQIPFTGSPFHVDGTTYHVCTQGSRYYKCRSLDRDVREDEDEDENQVPLRKRRKVNKSIKMGCPAKMTVKIVRVYPDYQTNHESWRRKQDVLNRLKADLKMSPPPREEVHYWIALSSERSHTHKRTTTQKIQLLHPDLIAEIYRLVESGITAVPVVKTRLQTFVHDMFRDPKLQPEPSNTAFYPSDKSIYNHVYEAKMLRNRQREEANITESSVPTIPQKSSTPAHSTNAVTCVRQQLAMQSEKHSSDIIVDTPSARSWNEQPVTTSNLVQVMNSNGTVVFMVAQSIPDHRDDGAEDETVAPESTGLVNVDENVYSLNVGEPPVPVISLNNNGEIFLSQNCGDMHATNESGLIGPGLKSSILTLNRPCGADVNRVITMDGNVVLDVRLTNTQENIQTKLPSRETSQSDVLDMCGPPLHGSGQANLSPRQEHESDAVLNMCLPDLEENRRTKLSSTRERGSQCDDLDVRLLNHRDVGKPDLSSQEESNEDLSRKFQLAPHDLFEESKEDDILPENRLPMSKLLLEIPKETVAQYKRDSILSVDFPIQDYFLKIDGGQCSLEGENVEGHRRTSQNLAQELAVACLEQQRRGAEEFITAEFDDQGILRLPPPRQQEIEAPEHSVPQHDIQQQFIRHHFEQELNVQSLHQDHEDERHLEQLQAVAQQFNKQRFEQQQSEQSVQRELEMQEVLQQNAQLHIVGKQFDKGQSFELLLVGPPEHQEVVHHHPDEQLQIIGQQFSKQQCFEQDHRMQLVLVGTEQTNVLQQDQNEPLQVVGQHFSKSHLFEQEQEGTPMPENEHLEILQHQRVQQLQVAAKDFVPMDSMQHQLQEVLQQPASELKQDFEQHSVRHPHSKLLHHLQSELPDHLQQQHVLHLHPDEGQLVVGQLFDKCQHKQENVEPCSREYKGQKEKLVVHQQIVRQHLIETHLEDSEQCIVSNKQTIQEKEGEQLQRFEVQHPVGPPPVETDTIHQIKKKIKQHRYVHQLQQAQTIQSQGPNEVTENGYQHLTKEIVKQQQESRERRAKKIKGRSPATKTTEMGKKSCTEKECHIRRKLRDRAQDIINLSYSCGNNTLLEEIYDALDEFQNRIKNDIEKNKFGAGPKKLLDSESNVQPHQEQSTCRNSEEREGDCIQSTSLTKADQQLSGGIPEVLRVSEQNAPTGNCELQSDVAGGSRVKNVVGAASVVCQPHSSVNEKKKEYIRSTTLGKCEPSVTVKSSDGEKECMAGTTVINCELVPLGAIEVVNRYLQGGLMM